MRIIELELGAVKNLVWLGIVVRIALGIPHDHPDKGK